MTRLYTFDHSKVTEFTPIMEILYQNLPLKLDENLHSAGWYVSASENLVRILGKSTLGTYLGLEVDSTEKIMWARLYYKDGTIAGEPSEMSDSVPIRCECPNCKSMKVLKKKIWSSETYKRRVLELSNLFDDFQFGKVYPLNNTFFNPHKLPEEGEENDR